MNEYQENVICRNCGSSDVKKYCSNCGQKVYVSRFTFKGFFKVMFSALNLERGILYTLKMLFINPGKVVHDYLNGRTKPYVNPLNYLLIIAGINAFLILWLNILDSSVEMSNSIFNYEGTDVSQEALKFQQQWIETVKKYMNFIPLFMIPFASIVSKIYYRSHKLFYGEHLVLLTYIFGQSLLISSVLSLFVLVFPNLVSAFPFINLLAALIYFAFSFKKIFGRSVFRAIFGSIFIYVLGMFLFMIVLMIVMSIVIFIILALGFDLV